MPVRSLRGSFTGTDVGIPWRDVPAVFGPWQTIWTWHRRMSAEGTWDAILARLLSAAEEAGIVDWAMVDSTIARAHQHARGAGSNYKNPRIEPPDHGIGRSRGGHDHWWCWCRPAKATKPQSLSICWRI